MADLERLRVDFAGDILRQRSRLRNLEKSRPDEDAVKLAYNIQAQTQRAANEARKVYQNMKEMQEYAAPVHG